VKRIELLDLTDEARDLIRECEVQGTRTQFERGGRPVAMLVSYDEYVALRETIALSNEPLLWARIEAAEEEARLGKLIEAQDVWPDARLQRLRMVESLEHALPATARVAVERLDDDPIAGAPLMAPFDGLWVLPTDGLRLFYRIAGEGRFVVVLALASNPTPKG
jgi:hypothetical protein